METNQTIRLAIEGFVQFLASTSQWETHSKKKVYGVNAFSA